MKATASGWMLKLGLWMNRIGAVLRCLSLCPVFMWLHEGGSAFPSVEGRAIGAQYPAQVPRGCWGRYLDVLTSRQAVERGPNSGRPASAVIWVVKVGGHVVVAASDTEYAFDRCRVVPPLGMLEHHRWSGRPPVGQGHNLEMIGAVRPEPIGKEPGLIKVEPGGAPEVGMSSRVDGGGASRVFGGCVWLVRRARDGALRDDFR